MATNYVTEVKNEKTFTGNIVIKFRDTYFAMRRPDSGLNELQTPHDTSVSALTLNPTQIDLRKVNTTISTHQFKILDKDGIVTALVQGNGSDLYKEEVRIWLGRSGVDMPFSNYYELPVTYIEKMEHGEEAYNFNSTEQTERMAKPIYDFVSALDGDILAATTLITMRDDITDFPDSGFLKIDNEFMSYAGKDLVNNRFTGVIRGELNSTPADHSANTDAYLVETITDNPLNIILKILISGGGGGTYDTLQSGLGISEDLIDLAEIEALRDGRFSGQQYELSFYNIDSALKKLETELLMPNNLRFSYSINSKLTLALLDKALFVDEEEIINEDTITKYPKWTVDGTKITNVIKVDWDFNEGTGMFQKRDEYRDEDSISTYGERKPLVFQFKGIKADLDGQDLVDDFGSRILARLSTPTPEISINTQMDKSLKNIGDKAYLVSSKIPSFDGSLEFASDVEIIQRAINLSQGDVSFKIAFTSYTNIRSGFIAPSDLITSTISQKKINVVEGRAAYYRVGWYMRLWDEVNQVYMPDAPNKIVEIIENGNHLLTQDGDNLLLESGDAIILEQDSTEDTIVFENDWDTPITSPDNFRIRFARYDEVAESQKRYAFFSQAGNNFLSDNKPTYRITY